MLSSHSAFGSQNAFSFPRNSDWCVCIPLPFWPNTGFGMKLATSPNCCATYFTTKRKVAMLSAVVSASA